MSTTVTLIPGNYYHLYNRGNNRENIFFEARNYHYFLQLYAKHIEPIANIYTYCLLLNHFHFLVRIREEQDLTGFKNLSGLKEPSQYFSNFFNAYSKAINKAYHRTGALFQRPFSRVIICSNPQLFHLITYIHQNPQKHGLVPDFQTWPYSSYRAILSTKASRISRDDVLEWFGGRRQFETFHQDILSDLKIIELAPDDEDAS